jgi:hypothetical protein
MWPFLSLTTICCGASGEKTIEKSNGSDGTHSGGHSGTHDQGVVTDDEAGTEETEEEEDDDDNKNKDGRDDDDEDLAESAGPSSKYGRVSDQLVQTYVRNNPNAPELDFADCTGLTDETLWAISSFRVKDCRIEKLLIQNCRAITDNGLISLADSKVKIGKIDTRGIEQLTLVAVTRLLFDCWAEMVDNLPTQLKKKVKEVLGTKDPHSAVGKACLFLEAQPTAGTFAMPYAEGTTSEEVSLMLLSVLKNLANLTIGGLELDGSYSNVSIDLTLPGVVEEVGHARDWPISEKHYGIMFSIPTLGSVLTSLSLSNSNLKEGIDSFAKALPALLALEELDISNNELAEKAKDAEYATLSDAHATKVAEYVTASAAQASKVAEALITLKVYRVASVRVDPLCVCAFSIPLHTCRPTTGQQRGVEEVRFQRWQI